MLLPTAQPVGMGVPVIFDGLDQRQGYRADFLSLSDGSLVPITTLTDLGRSLAAPRTCAGRIPSRRELTGLPEHTIEQWVTDTHIAAEHHLPDVFFTKDGG